MKLYLVSLYKQRQFQWCKDYKTWRGALKKIFRYMSYDGIVKEIIIVECSLWIGYEEVGTRRLLEKYKAFTARRAELTSEEIEILRKMAGDIPIIDKRK